MIRYILVALMLGALVGYVNNNVGNPAANGLVSEYLFSVALVLLLFAMGFSFGVDREAIGRLKSAGLKILAVPLAIASGSVLAGVLAGLVMGINVFGSMAVSAGFGWYTLAGPLVGDLFGVEFGALGFVVNFLRELLTIVTISLTAKVDRFMPVAFGGATTMDTTLPIIVRYSGNEALITAFSSGFVLSLVAPFAITGIATLV